VSITSSIAFRSFSGFRRVKKNLDLLVHHRTLHPVGTQIHQVNGLKLALDFQAPNHRQIYEQGSFESELTEVIKRMMQPQDVFVDIGANFGWHSLNALSNYPMVQVHAFEPSKRMFELLKRSLDVNGYRNRCSCERVALSDRCGTSKLKTFSELDPMHASLYALADWEFQEEDVDLETLDSRAESFSSPVNVIKCDVEGGERDVLLGSVRLMRGEFGPPPVWFLEANYESSGMAGFFPSDLIDISGQYAPYEPFCIRDGQVKPLRSRTSLRHGDNFILAIRDLHSDRLRKVE
jgi:FkbM family methyltransferase